MTTYPQVNVNIVYADLQTKPSSSDKHFRRDPTGTTGLNAVTVQNCDAYGNPVGAAENGKIYLPKNPETLSCDSDGNLLTDGRWGCVWDAEPRRMAGAELDCCRQPAGRDEREARASQNRLVEMRTATTSGITSSTADSVRLAFSYDYIGRRSSATMRAINLAQLLTLVVFLNLVGCGNETKGHELKVMESTSEDFSKLESRHPWGDLGMDLMNGVILDDTNGKLQLARTGPYVPQVSFPSTTYYVIRGTLRSQFEKLGEFEYRSVEKIHICESDWEQWHQDRDPRIKYSGGIDYIMSRPHSEEVSVLIGDLFQLIVPMVETKPSWEEPVTNNDMLILESWKGDHIFTDDHCFYVTEHGKRWIQALEPKIENLIFTPIGTLGRSEK
ncbi:MAG: hypothetical protein R3F19_06700 [Verrucomicrobiales bacterium]